MLKDVQQDRIITRYWWAWLISIIGISCIIRFYFLPWDLPPILDGIDDLAYSLEIRNSGHLPERWPMANNGWPSMLGSIFSIIPSERFFDFVNYYRISNLITSVITIIPVYFITNRFFGKYLGLLGAALFAFEPRLIINSTMVSNDSIFILIVSLIILLFFYKNSKNLFMIFGLIGLATIFRYEALVLIVPGTILFFLGSKKEIKNIQKYCLSLFLFLIILIPFLALNHYTSGQDGISNLYLSAINREYYQLSESDYSENPYLSENIDNKNGNFNYISNGLANLVKFLGIASIPFFVLLVPYGIFSILRNRNFKKNVIIILFIFAILPAIYGYMSGFDDVRYLFVLYPIFSLLSLFSLQKIKNRIKKQDVFFILILFILVTIGITINLEQIEKNNQAKEYFFVSQKVVDIATGYNLYSPASQYIKSAELEDRWPNNSISTISGHVVKERVLIPYENHKTLREFIQDSRDIEKKGMKTEDWAKFELINSSKVSLLDPLYYLSDGIQKETPVGLSHIIIDKQENTPNYIQDVFFNEKKYPYLIKKFDSEDFGLKYEVKIFEIDYKKFDEIFN
tara:strand:- start:3227 stop:4936 length:1710 start_codon:yes stop_codon:yes gene_type:complete